LGQFLIINISARIIAVLGSVLGASLALPTPSPRPALVRLRPRWPRWTLDASFALDLRSLRSVIERGCSLKFPEPTPDRFIDRVDRSPERLDRGRRLLVVCPEALRLGFEIGEPISDRGLRLYRLRQQRSQPAAQRDGLLEGLRVRRWIDRVFAKIAHDEDPGSPLASDRSVVAEASTAKLIPPAGTAVAPCATGGAPVCEAAVAGACIGAGVAAKCEIGQPGFRPCPAPQLPPPCWNAQPQAIMIGGIGG
jgi:hypothetical protein